MKIAWCHGHIGYDIYKDFKVLTGKKEAAALVATAPLSEKLHLGGKALNFAFALARAGSSSHLSGFIGNDTLGDRVEADCQKFGIEATLCKAAPQTPVFWVDEIGPKVLQDGTITKENIQLPYVPKFHATVLHAINDWRFLPLLVDKAKAKGGFLVFNPAPIENLKDLAPVHEADLLIANESEAIVIAEMAGIKTEGKLRLAGVLQERLKKNVVVTLGEHGISAAFGNSRFYQEPFPSDVVDTVGAGDAFLGFFLAYRLQGKSISKSLQIGAAAGSLVCEVKGAIRPDLSAPLAEDRISRKIRTNRRQHLASQALRFGS
ncbi:MAG: carbohydrate kinase family protein [Bdellovibrionales bacterium]